MARFCGVLTRRLENRRYPTIKIADISTKPRAQPSEATGRIVTPRPAIARTPAIAHRGRAVRRRAVRGRAVRRRAVRRREVRCTRSDPATPVPATCPAGYTPSNGRSPAAIRCTIDQSTAINRSSAQKIRQSETSRSQPPTASPVPTTSPMAPRSARRLELGGSAALLFIFQSTPRQPAELKSKRHHSRGVTHY